MSVQAESQTTDQNDLDVNTKSSMVEISSEDSTPNSFIVEVTELEDYLLSENPLKTLETVILEILNITEKETDSTAEILAPENVFLSESSNKVTTVGNQNLNHDSELHSSATTFIVETGDSSEVSTVGSLLEVDNFNQNHTQDEFQGSVVTESANTIAPKFVSVSIDVSHETKFEMNANSPEDNITTVSSNTHTEAPKCPEPGWCVLWFLAQDTCAKDSHCHGSRICCQWRCSKTCIDVDTL